MTDADREKNEQIARFLFGWSAWNQQTYSYETPEGPLYEWALPDFVNDRDMDIAIMRTLDEQRLQTQFLYALCEVTGQHIQPVRDPGLPEGFVGWTVTFDSFLLVWATPEQRIDAVIKLFELYPDARRY